MTHIIDIKKKELAELVNRVELDAAMAELAARCESSLSTVKTLSDEINKFIDAYNTSMERLNGIHAEFAGSLLGMKNEIEALKNAG
jgi:hypothetical protein